MTVERIPTISRAEFERLELRRRSPCPELWRALDAVVDPEIPALSIWDLGVLRAVHISEERASGRQGKVTVVITPTYSGCPAMRAIETDIGVALRRAGVVDFEVQSQLAPAWSSQWLTAEGRKKLRASGIAPPPCRGQMAGAPPVCPRCESALVELLSEFGSTACKAFFRCLACGEPFDHFKHI